MGGRILIRVAEQFVCDIEECYAPGVLQPSRISAIEDLHLVIASRIDNDLTVDARICEVHQFIWCQTE